MNAVVPARTSREVVDMLTKQFELPEPFLDVTFGKGRFWRDQNVIGLDMYSDSPIKASWEVLPIRDCSVGTIWYDPPHLPMTGPKSAWRDRAYGEAEWSYQEGFATDPHVKFFEEAARVVKPSGYVIAKTADMINVNKPYWLTLTVIDAALAAGFQLFDWIISFRSSPLISKREMKSWHAKKHHAHWLVFVPPSGKVSRHA